MVAARPKQAAAVVVGDPLYTTFYVSLPLCELRFPHPLCLPSGRQLKIASGPSISPDGTLAIPLWNHLPLKYQNTLQKTF